MHECGHAQRGLGAGIWGQLAPSGLVNPARLKTIRQQQLNLHPQHLGLGVFLLSRDTCSCKHWDQMGLVGCGCPPLPLPWYRSAELGTDALLLGRGKNGEKGK